MSHIKNILKIFADDFKHIAFNPVAATITIGLAFLPALYAWFNIGASWDPYANTNGLKVAVVNLDEGASIDSIFDTDIDASSINIGEMILDELRKNDQIGWQFVDEETAMDGVESGKYYAAVMVPRDFSQKISSVLTTHVERPVLQYYVNEKKNAVATKITDKGVESIQQQVNETFISTISKVMGTVLNDYSDDWEEDKETGRDDAVNSLADAKDDLDQLVDTVGLLKSSLLSVTGLTDQVKGDLPDINALVDSGDRASVSAKELIDSTRGLSDTITGGVEDMLDGIMDTEGSIYDSFEVIEDLTTPSAEGIENALKAMENLTAGNISRADNARKFLGNVNTVLPIPLDGITQMQQKLTDLENQQKNLLNKLKDAEKTVRETKQLPRDMRDGILDALDMTQNSISDILDFYTGKVEVPLKSGLDQTYDLLDSLSGTLDNTGSLIGKTDSTLTVLSDSSQNLIESLDNAVSILNRSRDHLDDMIDEVNKIADNKQLNKIMEIMKNDPQEFSDFLKQPADMNTNKLYPVKNYGSAMTPFYTILAIWVGALLQASLLKCKVAPERAKGLKLYELYFGRYLLFMILGIVQAAVVALGDLYMLKIQCLEPGKFVLLSVISSIVFTNIIYSLVISFGDVGKAIAVVFMVLQVAGSGGTFPIQVTPKFFQVLNPLLPFTHLINAMRECVAGIYNNAYWQDIGKVLIYIPISLLIGIVLRRKVLELDEFFEKKLSETGIF